MKNAIHHVTLFTGDQVLEDHTLVLKGKFIESFFPSEIHSTNADENHFKGLNVSPGFIDLQIYGAKGKLFNNNQSIESLVALSEYTQDSGCTRFLVTLSTSNHDTIIKAIKTVRQGLEMKVPGLLGLHLEGPFINPKKRGAHIESWVSKPSVKLLRELISEGEGCLRMMTVAPEQFEPDQLELLVKAGILISAGHSEATYSQSIESFNHGIRAATHLFNAMTQLGSREPGLTGAILNHPEVRASIIADGIHCDFKSLEIAKKIMGERLYLITDSVTDSNEGAYHFIKGENRYITESGTLAGSALKMITAVQNCTKFAGISLIESLRMATIYPARLLNLTPDLGILKPGALADLVFFDSEFQVKHVFYEGVRKV